nr:helix-turn-helix transcriptional regulator [Alistipes finegoldii]
MKEIRELHNHTQEYVSHNTQLDISHYESGQRFASLQTLSIFCKFYKMTLDEFFATIKYPPKE